MEGARDTVNETLFEPVIRLGVTGLARSGKTVFIMSVVANLLDRGRMAQLQAAAEGRITAAYLQPQPDDTVPRFDYEAQLGRHSWALVDGYNCNCLSCSRLYSGRAGLEA